MMHEDEVLGKAYDGRLMRRLLTYLRPHVGAVAPPFSPTHLAALAEERL